ncbi:DUF3006 domain-containing protein [Dethiobacter alkaliphilus]|uniref:DUF3006 domain-containing protein n=1 Tax=Dethiobacter alkaliphilus TaxID=427926 RepID=UPI0022269971|nr:DUF3006 domain-containing protein [Dethiobacter alkaliphilus]MCW3490465.1 DUF3006 domain-containing protein [Dethiobacter alkaliphilus]
MRAVIERLEDDYAVVLFRDKKIRMKIPTQLLPLGVYQGCSLKVLFKINYGGLEKKSTMNDLLNKLSGVYQDNTGNGAKVS